MFYPCDIWKDGKKSSDLHAVEQTGRRRNVDYTKVANNAVKVNTHGPYTRKYVSQIT